MRRMYSETQLDRKIAEATEAVAAKIPTIYLHQIRIVTPSSYLVRFTFTDCTKQYTLSTFYDKYKNINFPAFGGIQTGTTDEAHNVTGISFIKNNSAVLTLTTGSAVETGTFTFEDSVRAANI